MVRTASAAASAAAADIPLRDLFAELSACPWVGCTKGNLDNLPELLALADSIGQFPAEWNHAQRGAAALLLALIRSKAGIELCLPSMLNLQMPALDHPDFDTQLRTVAHTLANLSPSPHLEGRFHLYSGKQPLLALQHPDACAAFRRGLVRGLQYLGQADLDADELHSFL